MAKLMPSKVGLPPLECWRSTTPSHAANWRPLSKFFASPTLATMAVAVSGPIPGTFSSRGLASLARCQALICTSISSTCRCNSLRCSTSLSIRRRNEPRNSFEASSMRSGTPWAMYAMPCGTISHIHRAGRGSGWPARFGPSRSLGARGAARGPTLASGDPVLTPSGVQGFVSAVQRCGRSSSIRLAGCVGSRSSTSCR